MNMISRLLKRGSAEDALKQIEEFGYGLAYAADPRKQIHIGITFDSEKRELTEWREE